MEPLLQVGVIVLVILFTMVLWWARSKLMLDDKNCTRMNSMYKDFPLIRTLNPFNQEFSNASLRDYYIKTAYNCCSAGQFKNDFVNLCALKDCIKQGARCLDFEIYSVDAKPVIAVSSLNDFSIKESYNSIPFSSAMDMVKDYAFSGSTCPNPGDPLILHFRIMTNLKGIYNEMANVLYNTLQARLLGKKYSYENHGENLGSLPIKQFMGKVIIIVDRSNASNTFMDTKLDEYVNLTSNSFFMRKLRYFEVRYGPDMSELTDFNRKNMSIVLPDLKADALNYNVQLPMSYGCQMMAVCLQQGDAFLQYYNKMFDDAGSAFILKPENLRYKPVTINIPPPPPKEYSYATRTFEAIPNAPPSLKLNI